MAKKNATSGPKRLEAPEDNNPIVLRVDYSDDAGWKKLVAAIQAADEEGIYGVHAVSDPAYAGVGPEDVAHDAPEGATFIVLADRDAIAKADRGVVVVDLDEDKGSSFRVVPKCFWEVFANLDIANMDFEEFAGAAQGGVFRGFDGDAGEEE